MTLAARLYRVGKDNWNLDLPHNTIVRQQWVSSGEPLNIVTPLFKIKSDTLLTYSNQ